MSNTLDHLTANVESVVATLTAIAEGAAAYAEVNPDYNGELSPEGDFIDQVLSFEFTGKRRGSLPWETTGATIVVTTGGPHVEVNWSNEDCFRVEGYYGSHVVRRTVECPPLASLLEDWSAE